MRKGNGFTLVELLVVISAGILLMALATPPFLSWMTRQKVEERTNKFFTDLKFARMEAERQGAIGIMPDAVNPALIDTSERRIYVALNISNNEYRIYRWQDENMNGVPETNEFAPDFNNPNNDGVLREGKLNAVEFSRPEGINKSPCSNNTSSSTGPIVNINNCPAIPNVFTSEEYCIRFDSNGFYEGMNNAKIFLYRNGVTYGIALNITGALQMCRWDENDSEWKRIR